MEVECESFDVLQVHPAYSANQVIDSPASVADLSFIIPCDGFTLRPLQLSDAPAIAKHANDVDVWRNLFDGFPHPYTLVHAESWCGTDSHSGDFGVVWGIVVDGEAIGCIGVRPEFGAQRCSAETGYWLGKAHWGKGIAAAALKATTQWTWANLPEIERLFAPIYARNPASQRVAQKAGYVLEARIPRSMVKAGEVIDVMQYAIYR
jgi:[ribosomal protein S5]-alanine N-acetyltransferase